MSKSSSTRIYTEMTPRNVSAEILSRTVIGLRARSAGWRESGALWCGHQDGTIAEVLFHHELGEDRGRPLSMQLPEAAKHKLYKYLADRGLVLLALLHTHPESWVGLSLIDQQNQISSRIGFWSIVLPYYGKNEWNNDEIGFHIRMEIGWKELCTEEVDEFFKVI